MRRGNVPLARVITEFRKAKGVPEGVVGHTAFGRNARAGTALLELANGKVEVACRAIRDIGRWLDRLKTKEGWTADWGLEAVVNNYDTWVSELFKAGEGGYFDGADVREESSASGTAAEGPIRPLQ